MSTAYLNIRCVVCTCIWNVSTVYIYISMWYVCDMAT